MQSWIAEENYTNTRISGLPVTIRTRGIPDTKQETYNIQFLDSAMEISKVMSHGSNFCDA